MDACFAEDLFIYIYILFYDNNFIKFIIIGAASVFRKNEQEVTGSLPKNNSLTTMLRRKAFQNVC